MSNNDKPTVNQHYIPQFYLKQFSENGKQIYQYNTQTGATSTLVPIRSICCEKNLYEFQDKNKMPIHTNLIENILMRYEGVFSETIESIKSKASYEENFDTQCFLSSREKALLIFFLSCQILRNPEVINAAKETALEVFGEAISDNSAHNLALKYCLPIYKELNSNNKNLLNSTIRLFEDMSFQIAITDKDQILTSDNAIILHGYNFQTKLEEAFFPLSPKIVLFMKPFQKTKKECKNRLVYMDSDDIKYINRHIVKHCKKWIYSKTTLTDKQIKWIDNIKERMKV